MARAVWTPEAGWHDHALVATGLIPLPGLAALQYGQEIFEGLKAFRHADGSVWLFVEMNATPRFARSAERMQMPPLPISDFLRVGHPAGRTQSRLGAQRRPEPVPASIHVRFETLIGVRASNEYTCVLGMRR